MFLFLFQAIDSYIKFLAVCKKIGDVTVEALAYNCLGVDHMLLACPLSEVSFIYLDMYQYRYLIYSALYRDLGTIRIKTYQKMLKNCWKKQFTTTTGDDTLCYPE